MLGDGGVDGRAGRNVRSSGNQVLNDVDVTVQGSYEERGSSFNRDILHVVNGRSVDIRLPFFDNPAHGF